MALVVLGLALVQPVALAATTTKQATQSPVTNSGVLKISPLRTDIIVPAGTTKTVPVYVYNLTSSPILLQPIENDFVAKDESGSPALLLDQNSYAPTHSLKRFMVPLQNVTVPVNSDKEVDVNITVPATAQAGGYFGAIRFAPVTTGSNSVNLGASVASLILMTVPGPTVEQLTLTNFDIQQNGGTATNFRTPSDLDLFIRFENKGNLQEAPFGQINVQKGKKTVYSYNFNDTNPKASILPDSARRWSIPLKNFGKFGKYTVNATFGYGEKGQNIEITKTIWIVPTTYIIGVLAAIIFIVVVVSGFYIFIRSYKRKILRSSRRRY